ncbi:MAG: ComEA family DNA-binding protein [Phycisphaeraceae bacterium]|nr:ComEA family DNA-binding protein [Phycisphaeraceae bacterium]
MTPEPTVRPPRPGDWTAGAAKWAAVLVLGSASVLGLAWTALARAPRPIPVAPGPIQSGSSRPTSEPAPRAEAAPHRPSPSSIARSININTATLAELELLPGIGPSLAQRIIDDRTAKGPFKTIDELDRVKGIGPTAIRKLRSMATVE